jgi:hypothetical protein
MENDRQRSRKWVNDTRRRDKNAPDGTRKRTGDADPTRFKKQHAAQLRWTYHMKCIGGISDGITIEAEIGEENCGQIRHLPNQEWARWILDSAIGTDQRVTELNKANIAVRRNQIEQIMLTTRNWGFRGFGPERNTVRTRQWLIQITTDIAITWYQKII